MSLAVACPSCSSRITAPDRLGGKTVRCPKCQTVMSLPAADPGFEVLEDDEPVVAKPAVADSGFEVVEDEPVVAKPRKKPRPQIMEDDDEDEDRTPRKKKKQKQGLSPVLMFGSIAGVVVLIGLGIGLYLLVLGKGNGGTSGSGGAQQSNYSPPPAPVGWIRFTDPAGRYVVSLPGNPSKVSKPGARTGILVEVWQLATDNGCVFQVSATSLPPDAPTGLPTERELDRIADGIGASSGLGRATSRSQKTMSSIIGREMTFDSAGGLVVIRFVVWNKIMYIATVVGPATDEDKQSFFAQFVISR
jgi:hypothetical protein